MKQTIARLLLQPNKNFPVDCETLAALQDNTALVQVLGNIVGDRAILFGCESSGAQRGPGYVFLRTVDYPEGEVLYWEGGAVSGGMYLSQETVAVSSQGYDFPEAYTVRSLRPGVGAENYSWDGFRQYMTPGELETRCADLEAKLAALKPAPLGIVEMWSGQNIPENYVLCDGRQLAIADCPELYEALGDAFKTASTAAGYFTLPDLRGRFIVGYNPGDYDYNALGKVGGSKHVSLTESQIPSHEHQFKDYYFIEHGPISGLSGSDTVSGSFPGSGRTDTDNSVLPYMFHKTFPSGGGTGHENRPPYYTLAYIMKTKN